MPSLLKLPRVILVMVIACAVTAHAEDHVAVEHEVSFADEILPIISDRCFRCHGPDESSRQAGLRLDLREEAIDYGAIVPGDVESSEMFVRITDDDPELRMPPPDAGVPDLAAGQIELLRRWIKQGAEWERHWAFVPPEGTELPAIEGDNSWIRNPIDRFVLARLEQVGAAPAAAADRATLARRVALSLTGLPPAPESVAILCDDNSQAAYEKYVDELLGEYAYGERMASVWMDLARYSDTDGFQADEPRTNWPWRDWVIRAYNANKPFDEFTIEQFAGDMLPEATEDQILATCFHRHHMTNGEGGRDPAESRVDYVLDRVNTVGTAWLGLTLGCAQCHTHKYDPITQKEYYQLTAYFNSIDEDGRAGSAAKPYLQWKVPNSEVLLDEPRRQLLARKREVAALQKAREAEFPSWLDQLLIDAPGMLAGVAAANWRTLDVDQLKASDPEVKFEAEGEGIWRVTAGEPSNVTYTLRAPVTHEQLGAIRVEALSHESFTASGLAKSDSGNFVLTDLTAHLIRQPKHDSAEPERLPVAIASAWADYEQPGYPVKLAIDTALDTGWAVLSSDMTQPRTAIFRLESPVVTTSGDTIEIQLAYFSHHPKHSMNRFRVSASAATTAAHRTVVTRLLEAAVKAREPKQQDALTLNSQQEEQLRDHFLRHDGPLNQAERKVAGAQKALDKAKKENTVSVMVLKEASEPRDTFVLERGIWDNHGEQVRPDTPAALEPQLPGEQASRLDLASWLVDRGNPLTARVAVNRYWQMHFGVGLVRTPEDFGVQGESPTHPDLLDWLAVEFMESGWDIKHIQRLIVTSATFQQRSEYTPDLLTRDPQNRWLARGPRYRMPAAMIRDAALKVSGLLSDKRGGPPVKPYQPENVWAASDQGRYPYVLAKGPDLYRRSLYTYWRRNISPPAMFDGAQRRVCEVSIRRTNSPMHALTLLNDTTYIEAARVLAESALVKAKSTQDQVRWMFRRAFYREPTGGEQALLAESARWLADQYSADPALAKRLLAQGERAVPEILPPAKLSALTVIASTILNADEFLNIE